MFKRQRAKGTNQQTIGGCRWIYKKPRLKLRRLLKQTPKTGDENQRVGRGDDLEPIVTAESAEWRWWERRLGEKGLEREREKEGKKSKEKENQRLEMKGNGNGRKTQLREKVREGSFQKSKARNKSEVYKWGLCNGHGWREAGLVKAPRSSPSLHCLLIPKIFLPLSFFFITLQSVTLVDFSSLSLSLFIDTANSFYITILVYGACFYAPLSLIFPFSHLQTSLIEISNGFETLNDFIFLWGKILPLFLFKYQHHI